MFFYNFVQNTVPPCCGRGSITLAVQQQQCPAGSWRKVAEQFQGLEEVSLFMSTGEVSWELLEVLEQWNLGG